MTDDLKKMFDEQNAKILKNKLMLDIDNNTDSLKLTLSNVIMLEMNKLIKGIIKFCNDNNIEYNEKELEKIIDYEKEKLKEIVDEGLDFRKVEFQKLLMEEGNE